MRDRAQARHEMVERLRAEGITGQRVLDAMAQVPREHFVPPQFEADAYLDTPLDIGEGQTISTPWIVAFSTSALGVSAESSVLEVGAGSGYGAAVLSRCCGSVVSVERNGALAAQAGERLSELGYSNVEVREGRRVWAAWSGIARAGRRTWRRWGSCRWSPMPHTTAAETVGGEDGSAAGVLGAWRRRRPDPCRRRAGRRGARPVALLDPMRPGGAGGLHRRAGDHLPDVRPVTPQPTVSAGQRTARAPGGPARTGSPRAGLPYPGSWPRTASSGASRWPAPSAP
jgi:hypothetical protein